MLPQQHGPSHCEAMPAHAKEPALHSHGEHISPQTNEAGPDSHPGDLTTLSEESDGRETRHPPPEFPPASKLMGWGFALGSNSGSWKEQPEFVVDLEPNLDESDNAGVLNVGAGEVAVGVNDVELECSPVAVQDHSDGGKKRWWPFGRPAKDEPDESSFDDKPQTTGGCEAWYRGHRVG